MSTNWPLALTTMLRAAPAALEWMLIGSAATHLQGAHAVQPGDVDILVHPDTSESLLQALARELHPNARQGPDNSTSVGLDTFLSSTRHPLLAEDGWLFGRWVIDGGKLEVARIRDGLDAGLVETMGREVWAHRTWVRWRGAQVPVVPVEIQWATFVLRGQQDRLDAVSAVSRRPWNADLAGRALKARGLVADEPRMAPRTRH